MSDPIPMPVPCTPAEADKVQQFQSAPDPYAEDAAPEPQPS